MLDCVGIHQTGIDPPKAQLDSATLDEIAHQLGTSKTSLKRALSIERNLTDSMKELLDTGIISKTLAADTIASLSPQEQEELISSLDTTKRITQKEMQKYIDEIHSLKANPPKPVDYDSTKRQLEDYKKDYSNLHSQFEDKVKNCKIYENRWRISKGTIHRSSMRRSFRIQCLHSVRKYPPS